MRFHWTILVLLLAVPAFGQETTHPFSVHDMLAMDRIAEPAVSPDGRRVAFTVRVTDLEANRGRTDIWVVGSDGTGLRRLTEDPASDGSPLWAPDSKTIYFLSSRSGSSQVWKMPAAGGAASQVTSQPLDIGGFKVSPNGSRLAFSMEVFPGASPAETVKRLADRKARLASGQIYDELLFRHWDTWSDGRRSHLFVTLAGGGEAVDVTGGMRVNVPSRPFGGSEEYTFTPDSKSVVFTARNAGREEAWSTNFDLYLAGTDGAAPRNLTEANQAWDTQPVFSPDGRRMAWLA
ncbi:MAG: S9 family peptidase, partial [Thermoanaerobaculia bacterium]